MGFVHIMLIGLNTAHGMTVVNDNKFRKIQTIYLIHSPDETKSRDEKKPPIKFKKLADKLKKDITKSDPDIKVKLKQISNPFDEKDTTKVITDIINDEVYEKENVDSTKQIAINITGGTNMMAAAAILSAGSHRTSAYYVLDKRYQKNLDSWVKEIPIPDFKRKEENQEKIKPLLYELNQMTWSWSHDIKDERRNTDNRMRHIQVEDSIKDTEWMKPQTLRGASTEKLLVDRMKEKYDWSATKTRQWIKVCDEHGDLIRKPAVPIMTSKVSNGHTYGTFKISDKEFLIVIGETGKAKIRRFNPSTA